MYIEAEVRKWGITNSSAVIEDSGKGEGEAAIFIVALSGFQSKGLPRSSNRLALRLAERAGKFLQGSRSSKPRVGFLRATEMFFSQNRHRRLKQVHLHKHKTYFDDRRNFLFFLVRQTANDFQAEIRMGG